MKQYLKITFFNQTLKRKKNWTGNFEKLSPSKINFCPILIFSKAVCNVKSKGSDFQNWLLISHDVVLPAQCACTTVVFWVFNLFSEVLELDLLVAWWCSYPYLVFWNRACIIVMDWVPKMCFENSARKTNDHMTKICQKWRKAFLKLPLKEHFSADIRKSNSKYLIFHH